MYLIFGIRPSKLNKLLKTKMCFENEHGLFWYVTEILNAISCAPPLVMIYSFIEIITHELQIKVQRHIRKTLQCAEFKNADAESRHLNVW